MHKGRTAISFLCILFIIVVFFIGLRIGKRIERIDKTYEQSQKTAQKNALRTDPFFTYIPFYSNFCAVRFLHPAALKEQDEQATDEAALVYENKIITIRCTNQHIRTFNRMKNSLTLTEEKTIASTEAQLYTSSLKDTYLIHMVHPTTEKEIIVTISKNLLPLFEQTLEFVK